MKYILILILNIFFINASYSQTHELGVFMGGSNFIGDVGSTRFFSPKKLALGGVYKWNRSPRYAWRISGIITNLEMIDRDSEDNGRIQRDYETVKTIGEISAGIEFNFFEFDLHKPGLHQTPYLYTGISAATFKDVYINGQNQLDERVKPAIGIPIILGYKLKLNHSFIVGAEIGARFLFTDNLDESDILKEATQSDPQIDIRFGDLNNNDWYVFSGITLTYTFGRRPCYCD